MSSERLWVCHECNLIGYEDEAADHTNARGHSVEELSEDVSNGILEEWRTLQAQRVTGLLSLAALRAHVTTAKPEGS
jgi:hypothetical protein